MRGIMLLIIILMMTSAYGAPSVPDVSTMSMTAPTAYNDGAALPVSSIAQYNVYCGADMSALKLLKTYAQSVALLNAPLSDLGLTTGRYVCAFTVTAYQSGTTGATTESDYADAVVVIVSSGKYKQIVPGRGALRLDR